MICCVRGVICKDTPEERVRQHLLQVLCSKKQFPRALCSVEISLKSIKEQIYQRTNSGYLSYCRSIAARGRVDVLFSYKDRMGVLMPFFLIECKAARVKGTSTPFGSPSFRQLVGYLATIGGLRFCALAGGDVLTVWSANALGAAPIFHESFEELPSWSSWCNDHRST